MKKTDSELRNELMVIHLLAAVPLWYADMGLPDRWNEYSRQFGEWADALASRGDALLYGGGMAKPGESVADDFNRLVKALACLSCAPGGVPFCGYVWVNGQANATKD